MSYKPSDSYVKEFVTSSPTTGAAADADSLPVATATWSGTGTGSMALTVTNLATGRYRITGTIPAGRVRGDVLNVSVAATVGSVPGKAVVDTVVIDDTLPTAAQNADTLLGRNGAGGSDGGRTVSYFLQGGCNKIVFAADGESFTVYSIDDVTPLYNGVSTRLAGGVGGLRSVDPN